jgi:hypothetical protein
MVTVGAKGMGLTQVGGRSAASPTSASGQTARPEAGTQQASNPAGFSRSDSFTPAGTGKDPVGGVVNQLNSQASDRAGLVNGQFGIMDGIQAQSNHAWVDHQLMMELIRLVKPS